MEPTDRDRYGRVVADVVLPDGRNLNRELVRAGLAWWFRRYAPSDQELECLEHEARLSDRFSTLRGGLTAQVLKKNSNVDFD